MITPEVAARRTIDAALIQADWLACSSDKLPLLQRDKVSLDVFWLKNEILEDSANLPDPDLIGAEILEDLRAALEEFETIHTDLALPRE